MPVNHAKDFWNPFKMRPYFHNCLPNLWAAICEWWSISQKTFLVKNHFKWLDLQVVWCGKKSDNLRATLMDIISMNTFYLHLFHAISFVFQGSSGSSSEKGYIVSTSRLSSCSLTRICHSKLKYIPFVFFAVW